MIAIVGSLLPVFILVVIGALFKKWRFPGKRFWVNADRLTYYVLLPALIIEKLATTKVTDPQVVPLVAILMAAVLAGGAMAILAGRFLPAGLPSLTSVFQGSIRPNTYVALAAAAVLYGQEGLALTTVILAGVIPLVNVLCILSFAYYIPGNPKDFGSILKSVISNPLVIACTIGITLNITRIGLPLVMHEVFTILSGAALPVGLISVGTGLQFKKNLLPQALPVAVAGIIKLLMLPVLVHILFVQFGVYGLSAKVGVLFASVPCAVSSYILAGQLRGDKGLMASIITVETLLALFSMPLLLAVLL